MVELRRRKFYSRIFLTLYYNRRLFQLCCINRLLLVVERLIKRMCILIHLIMIQQLSTRVLKRNYSLREKLYQYFPFFTWCNGPRSSNHDLISSIYIYIRTSPGIRDISIVASSACRGNNSAPTRYTGSACGGGVDGKPGQNTGRSFPSPFPPNFVVPSFSGIDEGESAGIQLSRQNRRGTRF